MVAKDQNFRDVYARRDEFRKIQNKSVFHSIAGTLMWRTSGSELPWYKNAGTRKLYTLLLCVYLNEILNGYDGSMLSSFQAEKTWKTAMGHPGSSKIGLFNAIAAASGFVILPFSAHLADKYGRRICIIFSAFANVIGTILGVTAGLNNTYGYPQFMVSRIVIGMGLGFAIAISPIMLQESPHPFHRTVVAGLFDCTYNMLAVAVFWRVGSCLVARADLFLLVATFVSNEASHIKSSWDWRLPYLIHLPFALLMLVIVFFLPESPRWLLSKGREDEARAFLVKYHANGAENDPLVEFEMTEMKTALELERNTKQETWKSIFTRRSNRRRVGVAVLVGLCINFSGTAVIQYYYSSQLKLVGVTDQVTVTGIGAGLVSFTGLCGLFGLYLSQRIPRRTQFAISWIAVIICNIIMTALNASYHKNPKPSVAKAAIAFIWLYNGSFWMACGALFFTIPTEIMSYSMRAKGMAIFTMSTKCWTIFNAYVNSIALAHLGYKWYFFFLATTLTLGVTAYFFLPETKGFTLEEIKELFDRLDGDQAATHLVDPAHFTHTADDQSDTSKDKEAYPL